MYLSYKKANLLCSLLLVLTLLSHVASSLSRGPRRKKWHFTQETIFTVEYDDDDYNDKPDPHHPEYYLPVVSL